MSIGRYYPPVPGSAENLDPIHVCRYEMAAKLVGNNAVVMDASCGSGFGCLSFPPGVAYVGVDSSADVLDYAKSTLSSPWRTWLQRDLSQDVLPWHGQYDLITCVETIEHVARGRWGVVLQEFRECLKPGGKLFLTTPVRQLKGEWGTQDVHVYEGTPRELDEEIGKYFPHRELYWQGVGMAIILPITDPIPEPARYVFVCVAW